MTTEKVKQLEKENSALKEHISQTKVGFQEQGEFLQAYKEIFSTLFNDKKELERCMKESRSTEKVPVCETSSTKKVLNIANTFDIPAKFSEYLNESDADSSVKTPIHTSVIQSAPRKISSPVPEEVLLYFLVTWITTFHRCLWRNPQRT